MNKLHLGILLLVIILTVSAIAGAAVNHIHTNIADTLSSAADTADPALASQAAESWQRWRSLTAAVTDHEPLERIDQLFAQLSNESATEHSEEFSMLCIQLSCVSRAIAEGTQLTWWNFL